MTQGAKKGREAEREVAKICEEWWQRLEPECSFRRTPLSGGWLGKEGAKVRAHFKACGDLMTTAEKWPFTVEVKRREGWLLKNFFAGKSSPAWAWWRQAQVQAVEEGGIPMLWVRKNQFRPGQPAFPWLVILPTAYYRKLTECHRIPKSDIAWDRATLLDNEIDCGAALPAMWFYDRLIKVHPKRFVIP